MRGIIRRILAVLLVLVLFLMNTTETLAAPKKVFGYSASEESVNIELGRGKLGAFPLAVSSQEGTKDRAPESTSQEKESQKDSGEEKKEEEKKEDKDSGKEEEKSSKDEDTGGEAREDSTGSTEETDDDSKDDSPGKEEGEQKEGEQEEGSEEEDHPDTSKEEDDDSMYENNEVSWDEAVEKGSSPRKMKAAPKENHTITMPDVTSHYFLIQKNSKKVSEASGDHLKVVADSTAASKYIFEEYPDGSSYNFTPQFQAGTTCKVGGGSGGTVSFSTVKGSDHKRFGDIFEAVEAGAVQTQVYNLNKCKTDPYAVYSNVGSWYDVNTGEMYEIDMKLSVKGYVYPGEETRNALSNQSIDAPYIAFSSNKIGVLCMATDSITLGLDFFYAGTDTPVEGLRGFIQGCDIDAQQGVDFGSGFEKVIMFSNQNSKLQYSQEGVIDQSIGYVSSRIVTPLDTNDTSTTTMALFSGASASCVFTLAKCDRQDTGGKAQYAVSGGYKIPADTGDDDNICYSKSNSTGLLAFRSDVHLAPIPDGGAKGEYEGTTDPGKSTGTKDSLVLSQRGSIYNYVLSLAANTITNVDSARYTRFGFEDTVDPLLKVGEVHVFRGLRAGEGHEFSSEDVTDLFSVERADQSDHSTKLTVMAKEEALREASFYGYSYYLHIESVIRTDEELKAIGRSVSDWYQAGKNAGPGKLPGRIQVDNTGRVIAVNNMGSSMNRETETVTTAVEPCVRVRKLDEKTKNPVAGVCFGLFGGEDVSGSALADPIMTAVTNEDGVADFTGTKDRRIYREEYGDGPYCIKELSVPKEYENVWDPAVNTDWVYVIDSLSSEELYPYTIPGPDRISKEGTLYNTNHIAPPGSLIVHKKSKDTKELISGAQFTLYEWSQKSGSYQELSVLAADEDQEGQTFYTNKDPLTNTMDNLGRYKVEETQAPPGCVINDAFWTFEWKSDTQDDGSNLVYVNSESGKEQTGSLTVEDVLQKGRLTIVKLNDEAEPVSGALFLVEAAQDIYPPWCLDQTGAPLKDAQPLVAKGTIVDEITTGQDGSGQTGEGKEMYIGTYTVVESEGASGHIRSDEIHTVKLSYGSDPEKVYVNYTLNVNNNIMRPSFSVSKLADRTSDPKGGEVDYDEETGRYTEIKTPGAYESGETVDFTIRVTNTGNTPLYHVVLTDDTDHVEGSGKKTLSQFLEAGTAGFVLPQSGFITTKKKDKIRVTPVADSKTAVDLSGLEVGDMAEIHFKGVLKEDAANACNLFNVVYADAQYNRNEGGSGGLVLVDVPTAGLVDSEGRSLTKDQDAINIPGYGDVTPVKTADRTTGIVIEDGALVSGSRIPGIYQPGETVNYSVIVKNTGNTPLKNITVKDSLSKKLKAAADERGSGWIITESGKDQATLVTADQKRITARVVSPGELLLCADEDGEGASETGLSGEDSSGNDRMEERYRENILDPGDYVILNYRLKLCSDIGNLYDLSNTVSVTGWYYDGLREVSTGEKKDRDRIEVPGEPEAKVAKLADRTSGAVLSDGRYPAGAKISGTYLSGDTVTYKITVTNSRTSNLYHLTLKDSMSEELLEALDPESVAFEQKDYNSKEGRTVRTRSPERNILILDFLGAGDSVDVFLNATVKNGIGNLLELQNTVYLTATARQGNEEEKKIYEDLSETVWVKLTYHSNDDNDQKASDSETPCAPGTAVNVNGNPFKEKGMAFAGWNSRPDGSGKTWPVDSIMIMPDEDTDLYAMWQKDDSREPDMRYQLVYSSNNPKDQVEADEENSKKEGEQITVNENPFSYEGYVFEGWNTKADGRGTVIKPGEQYVMPDRHVTLYATWKKADVCKLIYEANNGSSAARTDGETPCEPGVEIEIDGNSFTYHDGKEEYRFAGWNTRAKGDGDSFMPGDTKILNNDLVLYAQWEPKGTDATDDRTGYMVYYRANNQTSAHSIDSEAPVFEKETFKIDASRFTYDGMEFTGWNTRPDGSGTGLKAGDTYTMPGHDVNLYAQWKKKNTKTLVYHSNTKEEETVTDAQTPCPPGSEVIVDGNYYDRKGYGFTGWNTKKDGKGDSYKPGDNIEISDDIILYAQWTRDLTVFRLVYDSNLEKDLHMTEVDGETPCLGETRITVNPNRFRPAGLVFDSWNTKKDGQGKKIMSGDSYTMPDHDVTLYAQWKKEDGETGSPDNGEEEMTNVTDPLTEEERALRLDEAVTEAYEEIHSMNTDQAIEYGASLSEITKTELMEDSDAINVPGEPEARVAKLADRTKGATLADGRYSGTKTPGTYAYGETIIFNLLISNSGTSHLYNLDVCDTFSEELSDQIDPDSVKVTQGDVTSIGGKTVHVAVKEDKQKESGQAACLAELDVLEAGDSVEIQVTAVTAEGTQAAEDLNNHVRITASYKVSGKEDGLVPIPETELMEDDDAVNVGVADLVVAKLADKTTGATLEKGRYEGSKISGTYRSGDVISYALTAGNSGTAPALNVKIVEEPSQNLLNYVTIQGFDADEGEILKTESGKEARVIKTGKKELVVDRLEAGDSLTVYYKVKVKKDKAKVTALNNTVSVCGLNLNKQEIPQTEYMKDDDKVNLSDDAFPLKKDAKTSRTSSSGGSGKTGDDNPVGLYAFLLSASLLGLFAAARKKKRPTDK